MTSSAISREKLHTEEAVELHFVDQLVHAQGWRQRDCEKHYDAKFAIDPGMLEEFVRTTQPAAWGRLVKQYGCAARDRLVSQIERALKSKGTLETLRNGIKMVPGVEVKLCYFKPASGRDDDLMRGYEGNILTVMRQVHYSLKNRNCIDVVLFVNGIPVATLELKNTMTGQTYRNAEIQYRNDRKPGGEPILTFKRGALVHFALDQDHVSMTTHLNNGKTRFLPFNRGAAGGAGNPDVEGEFRIAYLYHDLDGKNAVFSRETLLNILHRFVLVDEVEQDNGEKKRTTIWPRYHQLDAVAELVADAREHGAGRNYLFQHSAGSGKSNTIAWAAHQLATLHDENDQKIFDTVVIVTDRVVLDNQLKKTVSSYAKADGYVVPIDGTSRQLREALEKGAKIIVSTIHKFSTDQLSVLKKQAGKRFAIIIDEAHSSQSGKHADSMARALSGSALSDEEELDEIERALLEMQMARGPQDNLSYLAFTATPKNVTLERFGCPGDRGPEPFHTYSMRQAIEEEFILDVLRNYQTYKTYFELEKTIQEDPKFQTRQANRAIARFVDFHEAAMAQKADVIVEHFRRHALPTLNGKAKAMIVTEGREHAVRTHRAIAKYIQDEGYDDLRALVAFSSEIEIDGARLSEAQINGFGEKELPQQFDGGVYNVLVVADKYQTGFDQPKLVAMYVDRKLAGIQAVQTLARLNRTYPGKQETFVLDFKNSTDDIKEAFEPYYDVTVMEDFSDPNQVYTLHDRLMRFGILDAEEIDSFVRRFVGARKRADERPILEQSVRRAANRFTQRLSEDDQEEFRQVLSSFLRFYGFISQIVRLEDTEVEKTNLYGSWLKRLLPSREAPDGEQITDEMLDLKAYRVERTGEDSDASLQGDGPKALTSISRFGANPYTEEEEKTLSEILAAFNENNGTRFTEDDFQRFEVVNGDILADENMVEMLRNSDLEDVRDFFNRDFFERTLKSFQRDNSMQHAFMQDARVRGMIFDLMLDRAHRSIRPVSPL